jgi:hypothetical protein
MNLCVLPLRLLTWIVCGALLVVSLPLVVYLRACDALDGEADTSPV